MKNENEYAVRARTLKEIGFGSYSAYLSSFLWRSIRLRVFSRFGRKCLQCKGEATEVHHTEYSKGTLLGKSIATLKPLCRICHEIIEREKKIGQEVGTGSIKLPDRARPQSKRELRKTRNGKRVWRNGKLVYLD